MMTDVEGAGPCAIITMFWTVLRMRRCPGQQAPRAKDLRLLERGGANKAISSGNRVSDRKVGRGKQLRVSNGDLPFPCHQASQTMTIRHQNPPRSRHYCCWAPQSCFLLPWYPQEARSPAHVCKGIPFGIPDSSPLTCHAGSEVNSPHLPPGQQEGEGGTATERPTSEGILRALLHLLVLLPLPHPQCRRPDPQRSSPCAFGGTLILPGEA